jgi:hypothetical protein
MLPELQKLGFTRNEANVYLAALRLGTCSVQELASATGLNRITVHSIAEKFENQQIFLRTYAGKRRRISPVSPDQLEKIVRAEEHAVRQKKDALQDILPSLTELFLQTQRGLRTRTFKGVQGYEEICEDVLGAKTEILEYANIDLLNKVLGDYILKDYLPRKHALQLKTKFLYVDSPNAREYIRKNYVECDGAAPMEAKFIDPTEFALDAFFVIYDNKLTILTPSTLDGVIIEDESISSSLRPFFHFVWDRAGDSMKNF